MSRRSELPPRRRFALALGVATAVATCALAGLAVANPFTVQIANSTVTNQFGSSHSENIVVNSKGFALYELTGDSKTHQACTKANGCQANWPPATVKSGQTVTKGPGVPGTLAVWRHNGLSQLTLAGHPLYRYVIDIQPHDATGQGVHSNGGTWHVIKGT